MIRSKLLLAALSTVAVSACAGPAYYQGPMSAAYEVPPKATQAVGTVVGVYYPSTKALTWTVNYQGLSGPATAAHIHGPAAPGANAPVVIPSAVTPSPITGGATLTDAQAADLTAGLYYFNIHTAANPGGEMRGQMLPAK
jgi:hypothetical protein